MPLISLRPREATDTDRRSLVRLINDAYQAETTAFYLRDRMDEITLDALLADGELIVAEDEAGLAGCCFVKQEGARCHCGPVAVDPRRQGRGIGRRLMQAAHDWARERGCTAVGLEVVNHRSSDLLPFYEQLGYRVTGEGPFPYPSETKHPSHMILLTKPLP